MNSIVTVISIMTGFPCKIFADIVIESAHGLASGRSGEVKSVVLAREDFVRMLDDLEIVLWAAAKFHTLIDSPTLPRANKEHINTTPLKICS